MTLAHPKPEPRPPKVRKPVARKTWLRRGCPPRRSRVTTVRRKRIHSVGKSEGAKLRAEARALCSKITLAAHPLCECGCGRKSTDAAHILNKKAYPRVRFYLRNILALAHECHVVYGDANVSLTKPSAMRDLVLSMPGGRERWESILWVAAGPRPDLRVVADFLRTVARQMGIAA